MSSWRAWSVISLREALQRKLSTAPYRLGAIHQMLTLESMGDMPGHGIVHNPPGCNRPALQGFGRPNSTP